MKPTILILLAALLTGCNDRLDQYRILQKTYPSAQIREVNGFTGMFLVIDTNNVARVMSFGDSLNEVPVVAAEITSNTAQVER